MRLNRRWKVWLIQFIVSVLLGWALYAQYHKYKGKSELTDRIHFIFAEESAVYFLIGLGCLMVGNYLLEALKWQVLLTRIERLPFLKVLAGILMGVLFSIFTPARLGELGGRVIVLKKENKLVGVASVFVGSIAQNLCIFTLGISSLAWLSYAQNWMDGWSLWSMILAFLVIAATSVYIFYNIGLFEPLAKKIPWPVSWKKYTNKFKLLAGYSNTEMTRIMLLSFCRVTVWLVQYWLIMYLLEGIDLSANSLSVIGLIFFLQTGFPLPPFISIVARSGVAVFAWSIIGVSEWNALAATFVIYILNLIIPALAGYIVLTFSNNKKLYA